MLELGTLSRIRHQEIGEAVAALRPCPDFVVTVGEDAKLIAAEVEKASIPGRWFAVAEQAATFVQEAVEHFAGPQLLLVKGSRGIRLEEVTRRVTE
jgi:UDP-N-acetylmuramyl pentapeptide synthase